METMDWVGEWLKVVLISLLAYGAYFLCWVKYPPRDR
jgi:hypothetical protein